MTKDETQEIEDFAVEAGKKIGEILLKAATNARAEHGPLDKSALNAILCGTLLAQGMVEAANQGISQHQFVNDLIPTIEDGLRQREDLQFVWGKAETMH